jgi:hypothetical protein
MDDICSFRGEHTVVSSGIMEEIRTLLSQGKSSGEIIALGYKPGSVYKVQRLLRGRGQSHLKSNGRVQSQAGSKPEAVAIAHLTFERNGQGDLIILAYFDPKLSCPGCQRLAEFWMACRVCNHLLPQNCNCPVSQRDGSSHGYSLQELIDSSRT